MLMACSQRVPADTSVEILTERTADSIAANIINREAPVPYQQLKNLCKWYNKHKEHTKLIQTIRPIFLKCLSNDNAQGIVCASTYIADSFYNLDCLDSAVTYVDCAIQTDTLIDRPAKDLYITAMMHNLAAILSSKYSFDLSNALSHYMQAYHYTCDIPDTANMAVILNNISTIYTQRKDTTGLLYSVQALKLSRYSDIHSLTIRCFLTVAAQYYLRTQYDSAAKYVNEAIYNLENKNLKEHNAYAYMLYGNILKDKGLYKQADSCYRIAMQHTSGKGNKGIDIKLWNALGNLMKTTGKYPEAIHCYRKGLETVDKSQNHEQRYNLLLNMSEIYGLMGDSDSALKYYKLYDAAHDSLFNIDNERRFYTLQKQYEQTRHENETKELKIKVQKARQRISIILATTILVLTSSLLLWIMYRRKNKMYADLAKLYMNYQKRIEELEQVGKNRKEGLSEADQNLFRKLESLMNERHLWRNKQLSLEMAAQLTDSSIQKVSACVNLSAACQFPEWVNKFRIKDAAARLSNPTNTELLKVICDEVGYSTFSTFYRAFIKETGMSPSKFREEMHKLDKKQHCISSKG